jgi:hypothetical protein
MPQGKHGNHGHLRELRRRTFDPVVAHNPTTPASQIESRLKAQATGIRPGQQRYESRVEFFSRAATARHNYTSLLKHRQRYT